MKGININDGEGWVFTLDHQQKGLILAINDQVSKARQNIGCMPGIFSLYITIERTTVREASRS